MLKAEILTDSGQYVIEIPEVVKVLDNGLNYVLLQLGKADGRFFDEDGQLLHIAPGAVVKHICIFDPEKVTREISAKGYPGVTTVEAAEAMTTAAKALNKDKRVIRPFVNTLEYLSRELKLEGWEADYDGKTAVLVTDVNGKHVYDAVSPGTLAGVLYANGYVPVALPNLGDAFTAEAAVQYLADWVAANKPEYVAVEKTGKAIFWEGDGK